MRLAGPVARVEDMRNAHNILLAQTEEKRPRGRPGGVDRKVWIGFIWLRIEISGGPL
jgi:hypothetical protein